MKSISKNPNAEKNIRFCISSNEKWWICTEKRIRSGNKNDLRFIEAFEQSEIAIPFHGESNHDSGSLYFADDHRHFSPKIALKLFITNKEVSNAKHCRGYLFGCMMTNGRQWHDMYEIDYGPK